MVNFSVWHPSVVRIGRHYQHVITGFEFDLNVKYFLYLLNTVIIWFFLPLSIESKSYQDWCLWGEKFQQILAGSAGSSFSFLVLWGPLRTQQNKHSASTWLSNRKQTQKRKKKKEKKLILGEESENKRLTPKHIEKCNNHDQLHQTNSFSFLFNQGRICHFKQLNLNVRQRC